MKEEDEKITKKGKAKQATTETLSTIADGCDDFLDFLQAVAIKSSRFIAAPFFLRTNKCTRVWFRHWTEINLPTLPNLDPQDHMGLTGVLIDVSNRLYTTEELRPVVAALREAEKETKG